MKKYCLLILASIIALVSYGQTIYEDVVYLKNGGIIRGLIIEQIPNKSIKIETIGRNVFFYEMAEIEKITKEQIVDNNKKSFGKRGYLGTTISLSTPAGNYANYGGGVGNGIQITLLNLGYKFNENIGVTSSWFGAANALTNDSFETPWSYGAIMFGPLFSFPIASSVDFDIRPMIGYCAATSPELYVFTDQGPILFESANGSSLAFSIGSLFRFNISNGFSLLLSADYFNAKPDFGRNGSVQQIESVNIGFGGAFRLR